MSVLSMKLLFADMCCALERLVVSICTVWYSAIISEPTEAVYIQLVPLTATSIVGKDAKLVVGLPPRSPRAATWKLISPDGLVIAADVPLTATVHNVDLHCTRAGEYKVLLILCGVDRR